MYLHDAHDPDHWAYNNRMYLAIASSGGILFRPKFFTQLTLLRVRHRANDSPCAEVFANKDDLGSGFTILGNKILFKDSRYLSRKAEEDWNKWFEGDDFRIKFESMPI